ncbi:MAG TPA: M15 family metallopeptidase [Spirillospora sp.]
MNGRHRKNKTDLAPILSVVLAGAFAGAVALAPLDGASDDAATPVAAKDRRTSRHADRGERGEASGRAEKNEKKENKPAEPPADCDPADASKRDHPNGRIPSEALCPLPGDGESLRADAALAFYELNKAYHRRFGTDMCVRSSYRSYEKQKELYESMPAGMAARPGNSKHGSGIALDLCGGVQNDRSPQFAWLEDNAGEYGWIHPAWAYSSPHEPWHWEFTGSGRR